MGLTMMSFVGVNINSFYFYSKSQDDKNTVQNSGIMVIDEAFLCYFGVIEQIWEVDYTQFRVPIFKFKWIDSKNGMKNDELGFTLVNLNKAGYKGEPLTMAFQAKQVFYVNDPSNQRWLVVLQGRNMHGSDENQDSTLDIFKTPTPSTQKPTFIDKVEFDDVYDT